MAIRKLEQPGTPLTPSTQQRTSSLPDKSPKPKKRGLKALRKKVWRQPQIRAFVDILWPAINHFITDQGVVLAGYIAFTSIFSIFPFLIFLLALAGFLGQGDAASQSIDLALDILPPEVEGVLRPAVNDIRNAPHTTLMTFSIAIALWVASSGLESLRHALNLAFGVTNPPSFWVARLQSMMLTIFSAFLILLAMVAVVAAPVINDVLAWLAERQVLDRDTNALARYAIGMLLMMTLSVVLYIALPNLNLAIIEVLPGAIIAVLLWAWSAHLFSIYLRSLGRYSLTYGSLGGIVFTLFFFYISAIIFIFGAQLNASIRRRRRQKERPAQASPKTSRAA
ncbi:MAG: YihY/virulence factor BrkB family protein [Pseudomonadota bacterium]